MARTKSNRRLPLPIIDKEISAQIAQSPQTHPHPLHGSESIEQKPQSSPTMTLRTRDSNKSIPIANVTADNGRKRTYADANDMPSDNTNVMEAGTPLKRRRYSDYSQSVKVNILLLFLAC